jgi:hypothetical protein
MYWTLQNLKDSEIRQEILHYGSMFSAATVLEFSEVRDHATFITIPFPLLSISY